MEKKVKKVVLCKNYKLHNYKPLPMKKKAIVLTTATTKLQPNYLIINRI